MAVQSKTKGIWFVLPWLIGLGLFTVYPFAASVYYSFTDFSVLQPAVWVGGANFREMLGDEVFWKVLRNTLVFSAFLVPSALVVSLALALLMNGVRRGQALYSVVFYLPHLVPAVASAILWMWIFNAEFGLLNSFLRPFFDALNWVRVFFDPELVEKMKTQADLAWGPPAWLSSTRWALPSLVLMALWSTGQTAFIFLAKLQDVPRELFEAAEIDGASAWQKIRHVALPMISPVIFFNLIMGIIGAFQVFTEPYLMTPDGGPDMATYFLPQYIWDNAFRYLRMGYACAMSWILFLIVLVLTMIAFRAARERVYYAGK
jgi:multiple sugar transport system permease protein